MAYMASISHEFCFMDLFCNNYTMFSLFQHVLNCSLFHFLLFISTMDQFITKILVFFMFTFQKIFVDVILIHLLCSGILTSAFLSQSFQLRAFQFMDVCLSACFSGK